MKQKFRVGGLVKVGPKPYICTNYCVDESGRDANSIMLILSWHPYSIPAEGNGIPFYPAYYYVLIGEAVEKRIAAYLEEVAEIIG